MTGEKMEITADIGRVLLITQQRLAQTQQDNIIMECVIAQQAEEIENLKTTKEKADG